VAVKPNKMAILADADREGRLVISFLFSNASPISYSFMIFLVVLRFLKAVHHFLGA